MDVLRTIQQMRGWRAGQIGPVGLVPTMGFVHRGHLSLVVRARWNNDGVVASIFVNPTQFGPREDLAAYPRDLPRDLAVLDAVGTHAVFVPEVGEMYPAGFDTSIEVGAVAAPLEGARRPGHFRGVATVVAKLINIVQPTRAYFGQKDAQQLAVIRAMTRDLDLPVEIVGCPTIREPDGLAMSSRNVYLAPTERAVAPVLYRALTTARDAWRAGEGSAEELRRIMQLVLAEEPLAEVDYVSVADPLRLAELETVTDGAILSMAVRVGRTRLIDNLVLDPNDKGAE